MSRLAAKGLLRAGIAMFLLCVACRLAITTQSGLVGDDLALIACGGLIVVPALYLRFGPREDERRGLPRSERDRLTERDRERERDSRSNERASATRHR